MQQKLKKTYNYFFLVLLTAMIGLGFFPKKLLIHMEMIAWKYPLIPISVIGLQFIFLFINRHMVRSILNDYFQPPNNPHDSFGSFKKNFLTKISTYHILLISILTIAAFMLYSFRLDGLNFWDDENLVVKTAEAYRRTGTFFFWDFIKGEITQEEYARAWPHTWLVAQSFRLFGVSEWSARIVSVILGCLFVFSSFFIILYFTNNSFFSFIVAVVLMLNPDFIYYFRITRMYALLLPVFFIWSMCVFQAIEGRSQWLDRYRGNIFPIHYFNFDYLFVLLSLVMLFWGYHIHVNSLLMVLTSLLYIVVVAIIDKEKKHIGLAIFISLSAAIVFVVLPQTGILKYSLLFVSFFKTFKFLFLKLMVAKPFFNMANLMLLFGSILIVFFTSDRIQRKKFLFCLMIVLFALFFFIWMVDFHSQHYRYICHIIPFAVLMICVSYFVTLKVFHNKYILCAGVVLLLVSQTMHLFRALESMYYGAKGQPYPSIAYAAIKKNLKPGEAIFAQYLRDYYMQGIPKDTPIISLGRVRQESSEPNPYNFNRFFEDIKTYRQGWVVWEKNKEYHIDPQVAAYVKTLFRKICGQGIDETGVEVYYFDASMIIKPVFK